MKKIVLYLIIACIACVGMITKSQKIKHEILVLPVDFSKSGVFTSMLDCKHTCAVRFEVLLEIPVEYTDELVKQLDNCIISLELIADGCSSNKSVTLTFAEPSQSGMINKIILRIDDHLMESISPGKKIVKFRVEHGVQYLANVKQKLRLTLGCYGPESFEVFIYGSVFIICIIFVILSYSKYGEHFAQKQESDELTSK